jgi:hypothetical protein
LGSHPIDREIVQQLPYWNETVEAERGFMEIDSDLGAKALRHDGGTDLLALTTFEDSNFIAVRMQLK